MGKELLLTKEGYEKLQQELTELETVLQPKNVARVTHARSFCDFNEDSEYDAALEEQSAIQQRIKQLQHTLRHAKIIEKEADSTTVAIGSTVEIMSVEDEEIETYTLVVPEEADPFVGHISMESPLGEALLGAMVDEEREVETPGGAWQIKIVHIH